GDLQLPAHRWPQTRSDIEGLAVIEIKPGDRPVRARDGGLFDEARCSPLRIEAYDTVPLRIAYPVGKHCRALIAGAGAWQEGSQSSAVEKIIAQDQTGGCATDKICANKNRFCNAVGLFLLRIAKGYPPLAAIAQERFEMR